MRHFGARGAVVGRVESGARRAVFDAVAAQALEELGAGQSAVDPCLVEVLAEHVHALAADDSLDALCAAAGCRWAFADLPPTQEGRLDPWGLVLVRRHRDTARVRLVGLHEVAHWVLRRSGLRHAHVDVWRLTLALGAPRGVVDRLRKAGRLGAVSLAAETGLPAWAAEARLGSANRNCRGAIDNTGWRANNGPCPRQSPTPGARTEPSMSASPAPEPFDADTITALWALTTLWRRRAGRQPSPAHHAAVTAASLAPEPTPVTEWAVSA